MGVSQNPITDLKIYGGSLLLLIGFAFWIKGIDIGSNWQQAGLTTFSLGFVLLTAYITAQIIRLAGLPLISGYIFVGIVTGPYLTGFLNEAMVIRLRLVDDLALSFIALTAGGTLQIRFLKKHSMAIATNILLLTLFVFVLIFFSFFLITIRLDNMPNLSTAQILVLACLLGVIAVARSPSSAVAIISECRAAGTFTSTVLGVTVTMDVLIIIFFSLAMTISEVIMGVGQSFDFQTLAVLTFAVTTSLALGFVLGKGIAVYIKRVGHDLPLFLLFLAFSVFKLSMWLNKFLDIHYSISLHLEPLLICISAGFTVRNFSNSGVVFMENMEKFSLPIFVLFFSLAGASLNINALKTTWPVAVFLVLVRAIGIFCATWVAGILNKDPTLHRRIAWMAYITQAGVAIGLAQLAQRRFPELGVYLMTLVLAVITINQIIGPITFKMALKMTGDMGKEKNIRRDRF